MGPSSVPAGMRARTATNEPTRAQATVNATSTTHPAPLEAVTRGGSSAVGGWNTKAVTSGSVATISTTRRYWMTATMRSSAPRSLLIAVMPAAPPALRLSEPVIALTVVHRPISRPARTLSSRVPTTTAATGSQSPPRLCRMLSSSRVPTTIPITACAPEFRHGCSTIRRLLASAKIIPVSRPPNNAGDGTASRDGSALVTSVASTIDAHRAARRNLCPGPLGSLSLTCRTAGDARWPVTLGTGRSTNSPVAARTRRRRPRRVPPVPLVPRRSRVRWG